MDGIVGNVRQDWVVEGGTVTQYTLSGTLWQAHTFLSGGTLYVRGPKGVITPEQPRLAFRALLLAGGGGGGSGGNGGGGAYYGGCGGAGGVLSIYDFAKPGAYTVVIGAGGIAGPGSAGTITTDGGDGGDTTALGLTAKGGGGGGAGLNPGTSQGRPGRPGASGGGGGGDSALAKAGGAANAGLQGVAGQPGNASGAAGVGGTLSYISGFYPVYASAWGGGYSTDISGALELLAYSSGYASSSSPPANTGAGGPGGNNGGSYVAGYAGASGRFVFAFPIG